MVHNKAIGGLLEILNLFFEVLVTRQVHFIELIFVYKVHSHIFQIFVGRAVLLRAICEKEGTLFERERTDF